jgi:hypothetical protein
LFVDNGDVFFYDNLTNQRRQITATTDTETNAHFTRDQKHIYFTRASNLYVMSLETGSLVQMTEISTGGAAAGCACSGRRIWSRTGRPQRTQGSDTARAKRH